MGGGRKFLYPKWVWSSAGGWWNHPKNEIRNTAAYIGSVGVISYLIYQYAEAHTVNIDSFIFMINLFSVYTHKSLYVNARMS